MCETKTCSKCGKVKGLGEFYVAKTGRFGRAARCKECTKTAVNAYRIANDAAVKERKKKAYKANPDPYIHRARISYWADPSAAITAATNWKKSNRERALATAAALKKTPKGKAAQKRHRIKSVGELRDAYVASALRMRVADATPELIALKREQLAIKRMARELKKAATKPTGETQ